MKLEFRFISQALLTWVLAVSLTTAAPHRPWKWSLNPFRLSDLTVQGSDETSVPINKVPVTLGVMALCPDAQICENVWDSVLDRVDGKVDIRLVYIGSINATAPYGVTCKHGEQECLANIQQLCMARRYPDPGVWWDFIQCLGYGPISRIGDEDVAKQCSSIVGADWDEVRPCIEGSRGPSLLRESVRLSRQLGIEKSCSILIRDQIVCVHDDQWKDCDGGHTVIDFVEQVNRAYKELN